MKLLDPHAPDLLNYRIHQNIVLDIYVNMWFTLEDKDRRVMPYAVVIEENQPKRIMDKEGKVASEFGIHNSQITVYWLRSWKDFDQLDRWGQKIKKGEFDGSDTESG